VNGSAFRRCGCRDAAGAKLGLQCPKLGKRGHAAWWFRHDLPPGADGKRRRATGGPFSTKADAEAALAAALTRVSQGTYVELGRQTVADYLRQWLDGKINLKPSTRHGYETHCQLYLVPGLGHLRLSDLRDHHVEELYAAIRELQPQRPGYKPSPMAQRLLEARSDKKFLRPPGPGRIRRVHGTLMSALNNAVKRGKIARNPGAFVELASGRAPRPVVWTPERVELWQRTGKRYPVAVWTPQQAGAFLDFACNDGLSALWQLVAYRGLRRAEVVGLSWANVDLDNACATISDTVVQVDHVSTWGGPKSEAGARIISLDSVTVKALRNHRAAQAEQRLAWGAAWVDSGLVFTKDDGSPLNPDGVSQRFERLIARSGLPPIRLHDLRHVAASLALAAGVPMKVVSEQLGHSSSQITSDIYSSVLPQVAQAAAEAVADLVPRAATNTQPEPVSASSATPRPHQRTNRTPAEVAARVKPQVRPSGAGGARTRDRGIMRTQRLSEMRKRLRCKGLRTEMRLVPCCSRALLDAKAAAVGSDDRTSKTTTVQP